MNIERFFAEQIREQRKSSSGAFHRRGKGVKHGINSAFRTPYYFMSNKEKKKLNGEVTVSSLYDTIIPYSEFKTKNIEQQITLLTRWREMYDNGKIKKEMGMANSPYFKMLKELGLTGTKPRVEKDGSIKKIQRKAKAVQKAITAEKKPEQTELLILDSNPVQAVSESLAVILNGLNLQYNGVYTPEQLNKLFTKMQLLVDGEENKFKLTFSLVEVQ